jgi:phage baseplate assembly protein gpV
MLKTVGFPSTRIGDQTIVNGNLVIGTAGKGIDFSADPSAPGMTSELLDDYEEGTWSPVYQTTGGSFTYSIQTGAYTKIGNVVYCNFRISTATVTAGSGNVLLAGLPFTQNSSTNVRGSFGIGDSRSFGGDVPTGLVTEETNTTTLKITYRTAANGGVTNLDASDLAPTGAFQNIIAGSFFYTV